MSGSSGFSLLSCVIFSAIILLWPAIAGPENPPSTCRVTDKMEDSAPFPWMINLYQKYISPINGDRCPMHPSCSSFAAQALREKGEMGEGLVMVFDRLLRCGRDLKHYNLVFKRGRIVHYDPVMQRSECRIHESPK